MEASCSPSRASPPRPAPTTLGALTPRALAPSDDGPPPLVVRVALRAGRVAALTLGVVGVLATLTLVFGRGLELARFDASAKSAAQQQRLADDFNSRSASVAALFGTPVELFVVMAVRAVLLRFLAPQVLHTRHTYVLTAGALALSGGVGYLVNNGFNALNVQLHAQPVDARISDPDLSIESNFIFSAAAAETSNAVNTFSEATPRNPLTNTLLRNLVLPFVSKPFPTYCDYEASQLEYHKYVPDDVLDFGIPQREWQSRMLPRALEPARLRVDVDATADGNATAEPSDDPLPMDASLAADLLLNALMLSTQYMPWGQERVWLDERDVAKRYLSPKASIRSRVAPAAQIARLLPENTSEISEEARREWFLREAHAIVRRKFNGSANTSLGDIGLEFAHVALAPSIGMDAVTFEVQVDPTTFNATWSGSVVDDVTQARYHVLDAYPHCGPWPARCAFMKAAYAAAQAPDTFADTPVQIHAFSVCADGTGVEALRANVSYTSDGTKDRVDYQVVCEGTSNSSLLLVSVAKRLVADALTQNATANASGVFPVGPIEATEYQLSAVATNLRKVFTFTVARLYWQLQDLGKEYNATCESNATVQCMGLRYELQDPIVDDRVDLPRQHLVVGHGALPLHGGLTLPTYDSLLPVRLRPLSLVRVHEPPRLPGESYYSIFTGDLLLLHNIKEVNWDMEHYITGRGCFTFNEDRSHLVLNNHMYMEHGLQATYTAGMFFLFQSAAVRDVISLGGGVARESLAFKRNSHDVAVWISIPRQNVTLTLVGCVLLLGSLVAAIVWSWTSTRRRHISPDADPLQHITTPHEIARVMLDEAWFPWLLLHRHVVDARDPTRHRRVADFRIDALAMHHTRDEAHRVETKMPPKGVYEISGQAA